MTYQFFGSFELLWGFRGVCNNPDAAIYYYGLAVGPVFFGVVTIT